jgi:hypothetical protein
MEPPRELKAVNPSLGVRAVHYQSDNLKLKLKLKAWLSNDPGYG